MAGKKAKPRKSAKKADLEKLEPSDVLCPICRTILIEPVTLPCNHVFCKLCFDGTMENANLVCPLCRIRVGSWFRKAKKDSKLIDEELWSAIQKQYSIELQNKYKGIDNVIEEEKPIIVVATPGEIRKEYELQKQKELEEQRRLREAEEQASAPLIKKLKQEEEQRNKEDEEKLRLDAALAKKLAEEDKPSTSKFTPKKIPEIKKIDSAKKSGPMDKFVTVEEPKLNRFLHKNEKKRKIFHIEDKKNVRKIVERKRISITPPYSDFATKEYTCHVLNAESRPANAVNAYSIFNKRSIYDKPSYSGTTVQKKVRQAKKIIETEEEKGGIEGRKSVCKSGYKSSESGSDDAIDQECKFYFKPIDTQKRHHLPGGIPLKIPCLRKKISLNMSISPPTGRITTLQLGTVISAFARFSMDLKPKLEPQKSLSNEIIEDETSDYHQPSASKMLKTKIKSKDIKISGHNSPMRKKLRRQIYSRKNFEYIDKGITISSPFYGFDNEPSRVVNSSPFYGFDMLDIRQSNKEKYRIKKLIDKYEQQNVTDNNCVISTERFYKRFKTYSRYYSKQFKGLEKTNSSTKPKEEPLQVQISKTPKNGINQSETIKNKLIELKNTVDVPSEMSSYQLKEDIDINRNIPRISIQTDSNSLKDGRCLRNSMNLNYSKIKVINDDSKNLCIGDDSKNLRMENKQENIPLCNEKLLSGTIDSRLESPDSLNTANNGDNWGFGSLLNNVDVFPTSINDSNSSTNGNTNLIDTSQNNNAVADGTNENSKCRVSRRNARNCSNEDPDSKILPDSSKVSDTKNDNNGSVNISFSSVNSGSNESWRTRQRKSPRKAKKNLNWDDASSSIVVSTDALAVNRIFPVVNNSSTAVASVSPITRSKSSKLEDNPLQTVNKTYQTRNAVTVDTNSKITDTFSKTKNSPNKSKNAVKKLKSSPRKTKLNNNIEESIQINGNIDINPRKNQEGLDFIDFDQRKKQEESDFEMAKKLQAQFDTIQMSSRTRRGTKRQITLDEMLSV